jgi:hypothetical protein
MQDERFEISNVRSLVSGWAEYVLANTRVIGGHLGLYVGTGSS